MSLVRHFLTVGSNTLGSRVLGFVREILIAATLGAGPVADAFYAAFRFPNLFRRLFGAGAFNAAFVPLFARHLEQDGGAAAKAFGEQALAALLVPLRAFPAAPMPAMPGLLCPLAPCCASAPE